MIQSSGGSGGLFTCAVDGHPITVERVLVSGGLWSLLMMLAMVWRAWRAARPQDSTSTTGNNPTE